MDRVPYPGPRVLHRPTLVLNRGWLPVHVTTVHRALCMMYGGTALAVATDTLATHDFPSWLRLPVEGRPLIRTSSVDISAPEVVLVRRFARVPTQHAPFPRRNLFQRDGHRCQYCGGQFRSDQLSIDHVTPRSRGGPTSWENCVLACVRCNSRKGNRTPKQAGLRLLRAPRRPPWSPYLTLASDERLESWDQFGYSRRKAQG